MVCSGSYNKRQFGLSYDDGIADKHLKHLPRHGIAYEDLESATAESVAKLNLYLADMGSDINR